MQFFAMLIWCTTNTCYVDYRPGLYATEEECQADMEEYYKSVVARNEADLTYLYDKQCKMINPSA